MRPEHKSLSVLLREYAASEPNRRLLGSENRWYTAGEMQAHAAAAACWLRTQGIRPGDFVALSARRSASTAVCLFGLRLLGCAAVLTDPHATPEAFLAECAAALPAAAVLEPGADGRVTLRRQGEAIAFDPFSLPAADAALPEAPSDQAGYVIFTSGSTGQRKAVLLSDDQFYNNLLDSQPLGKYRGDDIALGILPLEHVFGLVLLFGAAALRYALFFPGKTDPDSLVNAIETQGITRMNGVPSQYIALAEAKGEKLLPTLSAGFIGGSPLAPDTFIHLEKRLGMKLIPVYGMSECVGISCASWEDSVEVRAQTVGRFYSMNRGVILREDGSEAQTGQIGEICVDGPSRMLGYYGATEARERFFRTGDLGYLDQDGRLHLTGRRKEIIIRNGKNLSPARIEQALLRLPQVKAAAVVGLPDEKAGEVPGAVAVCEGAETEDDLLQALAPLLPKNERPAALRVVKEIPLLPTGKPDKMRIRKELLQWLNRSS